MKKALFASLLALIFVLPSFASAQNTPVGGPSANPPAFNYTFPTTNTSLTGNPVVATGSDACSNLKTTGLRGLVSCVIGYFNIAITLIMAAAVVVIVWGAFQMIYSEDKRAAGRETVVYGIFGLFAMVSIWGFVNILNSTFNLANTAQINPPQFQAPR